MWQCYHGLTQQTWVWNGETRDNRKVGQIKLRDFGKAMKDALTQTSALTGTDRTGRTSSSTPGT
jgi:hypothetical protein